MKENYWYIKKGYENNPLTIKPNSTTKLFGVEKIIELLSESFRKKSAFLIFGEYGCGKTTLIKKLISKYKGKKPIIYYSHSRLNQNLNLKKLLIGRNNFLGKTLGKPVINSILILDEAQNLDIKEMKELVNYYDSGNIKNLILINSSVKEHQYFTKLMEIIKKNIIMLEKISFIDARNLISSRLKGQELISIDAIQKIHEITLGNPRRILDYTEQAIRIADKAGDGRADLKHVIHYLEKTKSQKQ